MSGGSTSTSDTTTNQINQIPAWMTQAGQQNYAYAQNVAQQPLQQYQGQMIADVSPQMQQSWDVAANSGNVGSDQFNASTSGYLGALGQTPTSVKAGQIAGTNLQPYMDPYTQSVINATLPKMEQENALAQNQQANAAASANAFGGSRQGIQQGVAQAQGAQNIGLMLANLNNQNFQQAQAAATGDINRNLTADTSNQQAAQAKINSDIVASQGLTNTGDSMGKANVANFGMLQAAGAAQEMQQQNQINAQMAKFNQAFNYPQQQLGVLESSLGMTPHDTSTSGQSNTTTTTPTDWASIIKGGADMASAILPMSDKTMKTDITKLGKDPKTGLEMHAFRYKGDPKSYPKVVGPMAQEVEEKYPGSTTPMGAKGKLAIRGYAGGTPFVGQPSLAGFVPPSSPGVAKGIASMSAFRPPVRMPRGAGVPKMQRFGEGTPMVLPDMQDDPARFERGTIPSRLKGIVDDLPEGYPEGADRRVGLKVAGALIDRGYAYPRARYAFGTPDVDMNDAALGDQIMGGDTFGGGMADRIRKAGAGASKMAGGAQGSAPGSPPPMPPGWNAPSMGYFQSGFARGTPAVPGFGSPDTVPAMLTPGEAVLTPRAAQHLGRGNIASLNAMLPPVGQATAMPRAGARGLAGALANTKRRPKLAGGLSG